MSLLDNLGVIIEINYSPEFISARNKLNKMGPLHRWLSWRLRIRHDYLEALEMQKVLDAVMIGAKCES